MKAYILLGDNVFLDRFNIVSLPLLHAHTKIYIPAHIQAICIVLPVAPSVAHWCLFCSYSGCGLKKFSLFADLFFMIFVCNSTTVPLWSTSVSLPCCLMCTCTTPLWVCAAGWTLSWRSFPAYRSGMLCSDRTWYTEFTTCRNSFWSDTFFFIPIQVLRGDLKPAIETHEMLYQVTKQHKFLPEVKNLSSFCSV